jgi:hypothetical protein
VRRWLKADVPVTGSSVCREQRRRLILPASSTVWRRKGAQYRCRVCGTRWQKVETEGERRASLIRLGEPGDSSAQSKSE